MYGPVFVVEMGESRTTRLERKPWSTGTRAVLPNILAFPHQGGRDLNALSPSSSPLGGG